MAPQTPSVPTVTRSVNAPTLFLAAGDERYAYRRFGSGAGLPLLCLQHFSGTRSLEGGIPAPSGVPATPNVSVPFPAYVRDDQPSPVLMVAGEFDEEYLGVGQAIHGEADSVGSKRGTSAAGAAS